MKKNLITVLKKLLAAFSGEDTNSNNAVEVIDKIADTTNDNRGPLILEFATQNPFTVTTSLSDIKAAIDAGRQVFFKGSYEVGNLGTAYIPLKTYGVHLGGLNYMYFEGNNQAVLFDDSDNGWTEWEI